MTEVSACVSRVTSGEGVRPGGDIRGAAPLAK